VSLSIGEYALDNDASVIKQALNDIVNPPNAGMHVVSHATVCTLANTDYLLDSHTLASSTNGATLINGGGTLKFSEKCRMQMTGNYKLVSSSNTATVTIKLKKNGIELSNTEFDFTQLDLHQSAGKSYDIDINVDDELEVYIRSSVAGVTVTIEQHYIKLAFIKRI